MRNCILFIIVLFTLVSCDFIPSLKKSEAVLAIAKVHDKYLYESDIVAFLPPDISSQDSIQFVKSYIDSWAKKQLLLHQAAINLKNDIPSFEKLVEDYRATLYINSYKESLILSKLDTTVSRSDILGYYELNHNNFKLNETLVQLKYIHTDSDRRDQIELIKFFKSKKQEDLDSLQSRVLEFKAFNLNDSIWIRYNDLIGKIDFLKNIDKSQILKKESFLKKEDSLGLYLMSVKDVLNRNDIAPLGYVLPTIKQIILQKRKLELLRTTEVDLLNDAIKNQYFERY